MFNDMPKGFPKNIGIIKIPIGHPYSYSKNKRKENTMEILSKDKINKLIDMYSIEDTVNTFLSKTINKFPLTEDELKLAFQIIDRCFVKYYLD